MQSIRNMEGNEVCVDRLTSQTENGGGFEAFNKCITYCSQNTFWNEIFVNNSSVSLKTHLFCWGSQGSMNLHSIFGPRTLCYSLPHFCSAGNSLLFLISPWASFETVISTARRLGMRNTGKRGEELSSLLSPLLSPFSQRLHSFTQDTLEQKKSQWCLWRRLLQSHRPSF